MPVAVPSGQSRQFFVVDIALVVRVQLQVVTEINFAGTVSVVERVVLRGRDVLVGLQRAGQVGARNVRLALAPHVVEVTRRILAPVIENAECR